MTVSHGQHIPMRTIGDASDKATSLSLMVLYTWLGLLAFIVIVVVVIAKHRHRVSSGQGSMFALIFLHKIRFGIHCQHVKENKFHVITKPLYAQFGKPLSHFKVHYSACVLY